MTPDQRKSGPLEIKVLGDFAIYRDGVAVDLPPSRKTKAVLAYLAMTARSHRRERLCEMFWDLPDDPKASLRWSLSKIRQMLGDAGAETLTADRTSVCFRPNGVLDFNRLGSLKQQDVASKSTAELEELATLLQGALLADLSLPRCPDFEAWRSAFIDEVEIGRLNVLRELVARLADDPGQALVYAHRMQAVLPGDRELAARIASLSKAALANAAGGPSDPGRLAPESPSEPLVRKAGPARSSGDDHQETRFCRSVDGVRIAFSATGEGPPILRAAHWMSHLQYDWESPVWRHWMGALSERNRLIRYDERCNGLSDWDVADLSFEAMVADLETVADAAGLERFTLLGISQSCALSVAYAARHPERVSGLILYGGYVKGWRRRGNAREVATREALAVLMREGWGQNNAVFRQLFTSLFIQNATPDQIAALDALQSRTISPENAWRLQNAFADIDVTELLPQVSVPTIVLHARGDLVAPVDSGRTYAANIRDARFIELDSANHILVEGEPAFDRFMAHVHAFIVATAGSR